MAACIKGFTGGLIIVGLTPWSGQGDYNTETEPDLMA